MEQLVMVRRFILAALALAGLAAQPAFASTDIIAQGLAAGAVQRNGGNASNTQVTAANGTVQRPLSAWTGDTLNVKGVGAQGDVFGASDGAMTSGSSTLNSASASFVASDVGKQVFIQGSGTAGVYQEGTVTSVTDAHDIVVSFSAATTVSGALWYYGTDDSAAINTAILKLNTLRGQGKQICLYMPGGSSAYLLKSTSLTTFLYAGCVIGDTSHKTTITVDPAYSGDVFSWSEAWMRNTFNGTTVNPADDRSGPLVRDISITGSLLSPNVQHAFRFYDRNDFITMSNVQVFSLNGNCLSMGHEKNQTLSYVRESNFFNLKCFLTGSVNGVVTPTGTTTAASTSITAVSSISGITQDMDIEPVAGCIPDGDRVVSATGTTIVMTLPALAACAGTSLKIDNNVPAMEITSEGTVAGSNQLKFFGVDIFNSAGKALVIRSKATGTPIGQIHFLGFRVESGTAGNGDQVQIGDTSTTFAGEPANISFVNYLSNSSVANYASIASYANSVATAPYGITVVDGAIGPGAGYALNIQAGRLMNISFSNVATTGTVLNVAANASGYIGCCILLNGEGYEQNWSTSFGDGAVSQYFRNSFGGNITNKSSGRSSASLGEVNQTNGGWEITAGYGNQGNGFYTALFGRSTTDRGRYGGFALGTNYFTAGNRGDSALAATTLLGSVAPNTTVTLTSDGLTPSTVNILNATPGTGASYMSGTYSGYANVFDPTAGKSYSYLIAFGIRRTNGPTTTITWSSVTAVGGDAALNNITFTITADSTNNGVLIAATNPTGNPNAVHITYAPIGAETQ